MRLLSFSPRGDLTWAEFTQDMPPPYAILSHTWGAEEVTFADLISGHARSRAGYRKIIFCGEQAARDKLQYFWVDSCCIDKRDNTALTKAINSMFRYYRNAVKCYVYLSDVSCSASSPNQSAWEADFRKSRWFTRGWTLQELLAPTQVEFYSTQHQHLGDKGSLHPLIHDITRIPIEALRNQPLDTFSIEERMKWTTGRQTTEEEDGAYCLLGIFNIFMPLIYGEGKASALRRLQRELEGIPATAKICFTVPFERNPRFTGREALLTNLEGRLFKGEQTTKTAIFGLGGIGKTQVALELAYRTRMKYSNCLVLWIPAIDMDSLHQAYRDVAQQLCISGWDEEEADVKKLVQMHLSQESTRPWLCIFDNADDLNMWIHPPGSEPGSGGLKEYLPKSKQGCVVFTMRDKKAAVKLAGRDIVEVPELDDDGAIQLLRESLVNHSLLDDQRDARALLRQFTNLPLAIVQAAAFINENSMALRDYLSLLNEQEGDVIELLSEDFEDEYRYSSIKNPVATTWLISFEQIRRRDPLAADYLSFMACIDAKAVPQSILPPGPSRKKAIEAIGTLSAYSFLTKQTTGQLFDLHQLVHIATRNWLRANDSLTSWTIKTLERVSKEFPEIEHTNRDLWRAYLPHARYILASGLSSGHAEVKSSLLERVGSCLLSDGRYDDAEKSFDELLAIRMSAPNVEPLKVARVKHDLATVYYKQGRLQTAEELFSEVLEQRKTSLGVDHPDTLSSLRSLASTYFQQGRLQEAFTLDEDVLGKRIAFLGAEHPDTLASLSNLASAYRAAGRLHEAETVQVRVMTIRHRVLGAEHPDTLTGMENLARTYTRQGRWEEAERLAMRVMETQCRVLGMEHPDMLSSRAALASIYRGQGRTAEADKLETEALEGCREVLGPNHPSTLRVMASLAVSFSNQERWGEAEKLLRHIVHSNMKSVGIHHSHSSDSMANLALMLSNQGRWKEAEQLEVQVMETRMRSFGEQNPSTLTSMANLASLYRNQGRWKEAEKLEARVMETRVRVLGEEHPDTLTSMANLAFTWKGQGRDADALQLMEKCVQSRTQAFGASHPHTCSLSDVLAAWRLECFTIDDNHA
ncbi:hypothetical protein GJ744_009053 [Endocarpon pusillum]|uniref:Heterokaryon incompatibility domain-containing protein n=1 Tax=Endocarpon pusillum TaxID=364733 RepID=A0A8H7E6I3_9EURO|nr:hypothetical protein GJ744_009053 [Endocarpon pusillum]